MFGNKSWLLAPLLLLSLSAHALETDNYIVWGKELKDSADALNGFVKAEIEEAIEESNSKRYVQSCEDITFRIAKKFRAKAPIWHPMEDWIRENLTEEQVFPHSKKWVKQSIYQIAFRFYLKNMPIAPNVQINGYYLGTDKLSHFSSTGRRYLKHYLKMVKKGMTPEEAMKSAVRYGLDNEATILGLWPAGVFSYGDMEANWQGFLFYKKMCMDEKESYLTQLEDGRWALKTTPDIRDYISAYWDETFNLSYRLPSNWSVTSLMIKKLYCPEEARSLGAPRLEYYNSKPFTSFSLEYIKELQAENYYRAPVPQNEEQSFIGLCQ